MDDQTEIDREYIRISKNRTLILNTIGYGVFTQRQLMIKLDTYRTTISKHLRNLIATGYVEEVDPSIKQGKLYRLTEKGKKIYDVFYLDE